MDILFVVDDSGSMGEEQANLGTNFPRFIQVLNDFRTAAGTELDYRIGVTTTGVDFEQNIVFDLGGFPMSLPIGGEGPDGAFVAGCGVDRSWIERSDPDVTGAFSCRANVGTSGSGTEMPLKALNLAITDRLGDGSNTGFLREDALLAVVILTDEDDCSHREDSAPDIEFTGVGLPDISALSDQCDPEADTIFPIEELIRNIDTVKADRGRWAVSVIAGPGPGSCESAFGQAAEATRLRTFLGQVGENTSFSSICEGDLATGLTTAIETFDAACESFPPLI